MTDIVSVRLSGKPVCRFPAPTDTTPAILITLSAGGDLDYADQATLISALQWRREMT